MLTRYGTCVAVGALAVAVVAAGCGDDGGPDDPATDLADRVSAILDEEGSEVVDRLVQSGTTGIDAAGLAEAAVVCPRVTDPAPGDRATCRVTIDDLELELDVEFQDGGGIDVIALAVAP